MGDFKNFIVPNSKKDGGFFITDWKELCQELAMTSDIKEENHMSLKDLAKEMKEIYWGKRK